MEVAYCDCLCGKLASEIFVEKNENECSEQPKTTIKNRSDENDLEQHSKAHSKKPERRSRCSGGSAQARVPRNKAGVSPASTPRNGPCEELLASLRTILTEALEFNRQEARAAAESGFEEETLSV